MNAFALPFFLLVWLFGRSGAKGLDLTRRTSDQIPPSPPRPPPAPPVVRLPPMVVTPSAPATRPPPILATTTPAPWPQVVPAGLPPFPGPGWVPDSPPGAGVAARAAQLLPVLWRHGPGTFKTEQTAGRWITYRATQMGSKRGVVAFREIAPAMAPTLTSTPAPAPVRPAARPAPSPAPASSVSLPTLRMGSKGPDVVTLQRKLGVKADGDFGPITYRAVRTYQQRNGLTVDGIVGPQTWASLFGRSS